jgi:CheY-like chemotaxis protein
MSEIRIVVIEDNPADVLILRYALDNQGEEYELEVLKNGEEALQFVREHRSGRRKPEPCLILLDLHLPQYDGLEILRAIAQAPALHHIKVVTLTGVATPAEEMEVIRLGAILREKPSSLEGQAQLAAEIIAICKQLPFAANA